MANTINPQSARGVACSSSQLVMVPVGRGIAATRMRRGRASRRAAAVAHQRDAVVARRGAAVVARAQGDDRSGFMTGFLVGGLVCGALGFLLAPQISKALAGDGQRPQEEGPDVPMDPEAAKQHLEERIAQLNASIDEVSARLEQPAGAGVEVAVS